MFRWDANRYLPALAVLISLAITALTVTAVVRQSGTIEENEKKAALAAAVELDVRRANSFKSYLNAIFREAFANAEEGEDALNTWFVGREFVPMWWFMCETDEEGGFRILPLTASESRFPERNLSETHGIETDEFVNRDYEAVIRQLDDLDDEEILRERAQNGVILAANRRKLAIQTKNLDLLREAGDDYRKAADWFRGEPAAISGYFGAMLASFDCFQESGNHKTAHAILLTLMDAMITAHPGSWGSTELMMVRPRYVKAHGAADFDAALLQKRLETLEGLVKMRGAFKRDVLEEYRVFPKNADRKEILFIHANDANGNKIIIASKGISGQRRIAFVAPLKDVIDANWRGDEAHEDWIVSIDETLPEAEVFHRLSDCFGNAALQPSDIQAYRLKLSARTRTTVLAVATFGTAAAWGIVIWLMIRGLNRQRELVSLQQRFMADVSHELKTPLALIRLSAETLVEGRFRDPTRAKEYQSTIAHESERLTMLLENILDFSRIELNRKKYEFAPCDVSIAVKQAWSLFFPRFASENFRTELVVPVDLPETWADSQAIEQIIVNLLQNAYRYSDKEKFVKVVVRKDNDDIVISVTDRGIGMNKALLRRLGKSFERGTDAVVRKTRGTGLGLAIVKHIVEAHEGRLEVRSDVGRGSVFIVRLPIRTFYEPEA